ncbi:nitroreductase [Paenibacillus thermoaerophilus]|uniref:Putative NAD(P)H nitroreductase n=1 Tax=Paenibacillus thermoaerophilus TaxID=1215385 RepID=A0ABW2V3B6_9BACL|nr:nitroreductase [Paenibacillus thermoaerophilus]TMV14313.1 nitroreductase [Paenibacillus thermoaerophilus]
MELSTVIRERRTVHQFEDRPVPLELVKELLDTAVWAPNHKMTQPWRFVVVHGEGRHRLADIARSLAEKREADPEKSKSLGQKFYDRFISVPMYVVIVMREASDPVVREEDYAATSCVAHNFGLLAWERGIGMVWETYPLLHVPEFREALGVGPGEKIVASMHVGYPAKIPPAQPRKPAAELLTVIDQP